MKVPDNAEMRQLTQIADKVKSKIKSKPIGKIFDSEKQSDSQLATE